MYYVIADPAEKGEGKFRMGGTESARFPAGICPWGMSGSVRMTVDKILTSIRSCMDLSRAMNSVAERAFSNRL